MNAKPEAVRCLGVDGGTRRFATNDGDYYGTVTIQVEPDPEAVEVRELRSEKHLVAPVVAVAEGILNGGFLPYREIAKSAPGWNGVPVTVNHPEDDDGNFVPATQPTTLERYQIGQFLNVEANQEKQALTGELWINLDEVKWLVENADRLGELAKLAVEKIRDGDRLEVSTGYWHGEVQDSGRFDGEQYDRTQVDLLPDHLAVLPNAEGACNWEGDSTTVGCGAPRANAAPNRNVVGAGAGAFAANSATVRAAFETGIDAALTPDSLDATDALEANLLDSARTPEYSGTSSSEWSRPSLADFADANGWGDIDSVDDLTDDQQTTLAMHSLLGDGDADTFVGATFFPVVSASGDLNENALDAVVSGRGAQADVSESQLESARGVARSLLEDEFDRDLDENVDGWRATAANAFLRTLGIDADVRSLADTDAGAGPVGARDTDATEVSYAVHAANCNCGGCTHEPMGSNDPNDRLERLANSTEFMVEELREMDDDVVDKIDESLKQNNDSDGGDGGSGTDDDPAPDAVQELEQKIDALEDRLDEQNEDRRDELVEAITSQTRMDEDDLDDIGVLDDVEALERVAEKFGAQVETVPNYGGRAAGTNDPELDDLEVEVGGYFHGQEDEGSAD
jgi:hypothetical protein